MIQSAIHAASHTAVRALVAAIIFALALLSCSVVSRIYDAVEAPALVAKDAK